MKKQSSRTSTRSTSGSRRPARTAATTTRKKTVVARKARPRRAIVLVRSKRVKPKALKEVTVTLDNNRLAHALDRVSFRNKRALRAVVKAGGLRPVELAPAFRHTFRRNQGEAVRLAETFAGTLSDPLQHRELFQGALAMSSSERQALVHGYRKAGQARGVVHAISQLPRAHGRTLMRDLVIKPKDKSIDKDALHQVLCWLRDAGAEVTRLQKSGGEPRPAREDTDEDVVDFFEDIADDIANAISSVVDAVVNTVKTLGAALSELVNWAANDLANLVKALVEKAGSTSPRTP